LGSHGSLSTNLVVPQAKDLWKEHDDKKNLNGLILISTKTKLKDTLKKTPICRKHKAIGMCQLVNIFVVVNRSLIYRDDIKLCQLSCSQKSTETPGWKL
jgi:hypothetical protein